MDNERDELFDTLKDRIVQLKNFTKQLTDTQQFIKHSYSNSALSQELERQRI